MQLTNAFRVTSGCIALATSIGISAQTFPNRPVRIVTTEPGAASDIASRTIAQGLTPRLGQQVIVENRGGVMAIEAVVKASPDGHTMLHYGSGLWLAPLMQQTTYDPIRDLTPITISTNAPAVLAVNPALPVKSVRDLIALAKSKPGSLNYGSGGPGSTPHLAAEQFKSMAGVDIVRVGFKATGPAMNSVITGEIQMIFATAATVGPQVKAGKLRALGVTSLKPSALAPDLPTIASVLPGYELTQIQGVFAPAKTPATLVQRLNKDIVQVLGLPEVKERFLALGAEAIGSTPEELAKTIRSEMARIGKVVKDAGIRVN